MFDPRDHALEYHLDRGSPGSAANDLAVRRLLTAILGRGIDDPAVWGRSFQVPRRLGDAIGQLPRLLLDRVLTSARDGFQKLRFLTHDGLAVETVLIPLQKPGAVSVCLSSQVGCAMGCVFCATARMSGRRSLATWEILDQWVQARDLARVAGAAGHGGRLHGDGRAVPELRPRHRRPPSCSVAPMAARSPPRRSRSAPSGSSPRSTATRPRGTSTGWRSASGPPPTRSGPGSFPSPRGRRWPKSWPPPAATPWPGAIGSCSSYVCISGENVGEDDARALGTLIGDTPVRLDLIDVTDPTGRFHPPTPEEMRAFRDALTRHVGQPVVRRYSGGADIQAACGTLAGET